MTSKDIKKWSDKAMFVAEPISQGGPQVYLISATPDPLGEIASAAEMYVGNVVRDKSEVSHDQRKTILGEMQKTKIKAPLEFVQFHFLIEGVTRGFTHQMVRQRTATYVQESTRFAVKEDMPVGLPPSLANTTGVWRQYEKEAKNSLEHNDQCNDCMQIVAEEVSEKMVQESEAERQRWSWDLVQERISSGYQYLINSGMPAEDARGLLPTNLLTRIHYRTDLRALLDHAGNRLCTQAQFEWRQVFAKIAEAIRDYNPYLGLIREYPGAEYEESPGAVEGWQWQAIAGLLRPICYATGKCEFMASFDRPCAIRDRVQANHAINRSSTEWDKSVDLGMPNPAKDPLNPAANFPWYRETTVNSTGGISHAPKTELHTVIPAIKPREWLADPGAAR